MSTFVSYDFEFMHLGRPWRRWFGGAACRRALPSPCVHVGMPTARKSMVRIHHPVCFWCRPLSLTALSVVADSSVAVGTVATIAVACPSADFPSVDLDLTPAGAEPVITDLQGRFIVSR